jgi:VanZ family protein
VVHFGAFAVLGLLLAVGARVEGWAMRWPVLIGLVYAATDEVHQSFVPGRSPDAADWLADALGVAAGCFVLYLRSGRRGDRSAADDVSADSVRT